MRIIKYLIVLVVLCQPGLSKAQTADDRIILKAMQDEMDRSMKLQVENEDSPFLISYYYVRFKKFEVSGTLGAVLESKETPMHAVGAAKVLLGNYDNTSDYDKALDSRVLPAFGMPLDPDYDMIREKYWQNTDMAYKSAILMQASEKTQDMKFVSKEDLAIKDLIRVPVVTSLDTNDAWFSFDRAEWEKKIIELSSVFKAYPELFNSSVSISGNITDYYLKNSEGITVKKCERGVVLNASVWGMTGDGKKVVEKFSASAKTPQELPAVDSLKQQLQNMAKRLEEYKAAQRFEKYYSGPVLYEGGAAGELMSLLARLTVLPPQRVLIGATKWDIPREECFGRQILDSRLTVKNYTALKEYKGKKLSGYYEVDAEGVVPPKELTLVENGFLRSFVNDRIPKRNFEQATGSLKFSLGQGGRGYSLGFGIDYGTLHFIVKDGCKPGTMKKKLIEAAKKEGLAYAYIIRKVKHNPMVYRVDVKDGKETLETFANVANSSDIELRRFRILELSNREIISGKMIFPSSVLVDHEEITPGTEAEDKKPALNYPLVQSVQK